MNPYLQIAVASLFLVWGIAGCIGLRRDLRTDETTSGTGRYSRVVPVSRGDAPSRFWACIAINAVSSGLVVAVAIWFLVDGLRSLR